MSQVLDPSKEQEFICLQEEGKRLAAEGKLKESLKKFLLAKQICATSKVLKRIKKLEEFISECDKENQTYIPEYSANENKTLQRESKNLRNEENKIPENVLKFNELKAKGKSLSYEGHFREALECFNEALKISDCDKVKKYIKVIKLEIEKRDSEVRKSSSFQSNKAAVLGECNKNRDLSASSSKNGFSENISKSETNSEVTTITAGGSKKDSFKESSYKNVSSESIESYKPMITAGGCKKDSFKESSYKNVSPESIESYKPMTSVSKKFSTESKLSYKPDTTENVRSYQSTISVCSNDSDKALFFKNNSSENMESSEITAENNSLSYEDKMSRIKALSKKSRELAGAGELYNALDLLKKAQQIQVTDKISKMIEKLERFIAENEKSLSENNNMIEIKDGFYVDQEIYKKLYPYQREGVAWMWSLFKMNKGGVLGDDMGLGKTFQVIAFLSGLFDADLAKHVLVIMPVSLIANWKREFEKWCPGISVYDFHGTSKKERERNLLRVQRRGNVLLTSYGMLVKNVTDLIELDNEEFVWDYVILDEGHKIKNPTKTTKAVHSIPSRHRLVLTGTPVQNNLKELWSLYDFAHQGALLGTLKSFKTHFENPITRARERDASADEKFLGTRMAEKLKHLIQPYFLRRTKDEIKNINNEIDGLSSELDTLNIAKFDSRKNDLILWVIMSEPQISLYTDFLSSEDVKTILLSKRSPLVELTTLKKICDHPRLLSRRACKRLGLDGELDEENIEDLDSEEHSASSIDNVTDETLLEESGKLQVVIKLLEHLRENGHRTLVFSLSLKILDMIHRILANRQWRVIRIDGTVSNMEERARRIQKFQTNPKFSVFLLTTQVGGVGLTLTAADRVIIYDPSWNPATDAQAVDRVYRIGQDKNVVVYRLITCGTVEEKIYRRQIFKDSITRQATGDTTDPFRYFSKQELRELFTLEDPHCSVTQIQLSEMHAFARHTDNELDRHIAFLNSLNIYGISDHDLMFKNVENENDEAVGPSDYIERRVAEATQQIQREAMVTAEGLQLSGTYCRPYQEMIPISKKAQKSFYKPPVIPEVIDLTEDAQDPEIYSDKTVIWPKKHSELNNHKEEENDLDEKKSKFFNPEAKHTYFHSLLNNERISELDKGMKEKSEKTTTDMQSSFSEQQNSNSTSSEAKHTSFHSLFNSEKNQVDLDLDNRMQENIEKTIKDMRSSFPEQQNSNFLSSDAKRTSFQSLFNSDKNPQLGLLDLDNRMQAMKDMDIPSSAFDDLDIEVSGSHRIRKSTRISCARPSAAHLLESDTSGPNSGPQSLNTTVNLSDDDDDNPSNNADISFVPDSVSNTPISLKKYENPECSETPQAYLSQNLDSQSLNSASKTIHYSNVGRITPLKVNKSVSLAESCFVKAVAESPILTPRCSPNPSLDQESVVENSPLKEVKNSSYTELAKSPVLAKLLSNYHSVEKSFNDDSPIKFHKKKKYNAIESDESDSEYVSVFSSPHTPIINENLSEKDDDHDEQSYKDGDQSDKDNLQQLDKFNNQSNENSDQSDEDSDQSDKDSDQSDKDSDQSDNDDDQSDKNLLSETELFENGLEVSEYSDSSVTSDSESESNDY